VNAGVSHSPLTPLTFLERTALVFTDRTVEAAGNGEPEDCLQNVRRALEGAPA
jgi:hypothetical protein